MQIRDPNPHNNTIWTVQFSPRKSPFPLPGLEVVVEAITAAMLSILRKARLKDKELRILML